MIELLVGQHKYVSRQMIEPLNYNLFYDYFICPAYLSYFNSIDYMGRIEIIAKDGVLFKNV